jgi:universal stress protein A
MGRFLMFQRILVPVDFSGASEGALRHASALAAQFGGKITLIHVIESGRYVADFTESETWMTEIPRKVEERLLALVNASEVPALFEKVEVRAGRPFHEIGRAARELDSDLIVMASLGHSGAMDVLLGTTAERVVRHAPCAVLVLREPSPGPA